MSNTAKHLATLTPWKITQASESVTFASKQSSWFFYGTFQKLTIQ